MRLTVHSPLQIRRPDLVVDDPWDLVLRFFTEDRSSLGEGSYDGYTAGGSSPQNRIVVEDIVAINATMSARSPHADWADLISHGDLDELRAIDTDWDLFMTPDDVWTGNRVADKLAALFATVIGKGIGISRATKVLHIKRPRLIPVCDSYVLRLMGIPGEDPASAVALIEHLRAIRGSLLPTLLDFQEKLGHRSLDRTLVRIADGLIWGSYPDTYLSRRPGVAPRPAGSKGLRSEHASRA